MSGLKDDVFDLLQEAKRLVEKNKVIFRYKIRVWNLVLIWWNSSLMQS